MAGMPPTAPWQEFCRTIIILEDEKAANEENALTDEKMLALAAFFL